MENKKPAGCAFIFGAILIIFTFVNVAANVSKWIIFAIGVIMVLHPVFNGTCCKSSCCTVEPVKKPVKKKK